MLFIDRSQVKLPTELKRILKRETTHAQKFFARTDRAQERFIFDSYAWRQTQQYLAELFGDTCAYCESSKRQYPLSVEHFRPKTEACSLEGETSPDWYWWLAYEWENLYLACELCNYNKKTLFPVVGKRANVGAKGEELRKEKNVLIDPCVDEPAEHLRFLENGLVESISLKNAETRHKYKNLDRGAITIEVLGLNRAKLVEARSRALNEVRNRLTTIERLMSRKQSNVRPIAKIIDELYLQADVKNEYLAVRRQIVARELVYKPYLRQLLFFARPKELEELEFELETEIEIEKSLARKARRAAAKTSSQTQSSPEITIKYNNAYIRSVKIQNFRTIDELELRFNEWAETVEPIKALVGSKKHSINVYEEKKVGWKMLLGENGTGKSSVLKAIAIALMGEDYYKQHAKEYLLTPERIFNKRTAQRNGAIYVELSKGEPIEIKFTRHGLNFVKGKAGAAGVFVRGYGSARLFARSSNNKKNSVQKGVKQVDNLFHPEQLLKDPNEWLEALKQSEFESVGLVLRDLLNLPDEIQTPLTKENRKVLLDAGLGPSALEDQSDGYNSILAVMADIMSGLPETMRDKKVASGIVLLDEIDVHLHPRWKMRLISSLRRCFPGIQFIATTHEPLCLRGLGKGEITVMKRFGNEISIQDDVPSVAGLRVDQLLTSELFGLDTTIDPDVDLQFQEYYHLLALNEPTKEQRERINILKSKLERLNVLGSTPRDRLVYEFIDSYIAKKRQIDGEEEKQKLYQETKINVLELWDEVKNAVGGNGK
jgi:uncharacterized protein (TIGR02646 family)